MLTVTWGSEMPALTVSAAWGSRSTSNTRLPSRCRPTPRLKVVVVLPTPPFWLTMAVMRAVVGPATAGDADPSIPSTALSRIRYSLASLAPLRRPDFRYRKTVLLSTPSRSATSLVVRSFSAMCFAVLCEPSKAPNAGHTHPVNQKVRLVSSRQITNRLSLDLLSYQEPRRRARTGIGHRKPVVNLAGSG